MLAQLERTLPCGDQWRYEPKLDGFRGLLWHGDGPTAELLSRNVKDLSAWFPELIVAGQKLPSNTLVDGEIVIADDLGGSDFGALQTRLGMARRDVSRGALQRPAVLLCFDLLTVAGEDLTSLPLRDRRHRLECRGRAEVCARGDRGVAGHPSRASFERCAGAGAALSSEPRSPGRFLSGLGRTRALRLSAPDTPI